MAAASSVAVKGGRLPELEDDDELDEEPGEVIESAPPLKVGEERELRGSGLRKKLLRRGRGWETPEFGDEVTVHLVGTLLDGTRFDSMRDRDEPLTFKLGHGQVVSGLDHGIITMNKGEHALFTVPPELGYGAAGRDNVPPNVALQFEVELVSWITVVDICKDGGIIKKIVDRGTRDEQPTDLDEVLVKYQARLLDGTIVWETPEEGIEFYVKDGHLCPALSKAIMTMKRGEKVILTVQPQYAFGGENNCLSGAPHNVPSNSALCIDLQLVSFKSVIDITGDAKVLKKILKEGEGAVTANEGASVTVRYVAQLEDGTVYERKGFDGEQPLNFVTDEEQVIAGLDRAAATMKKGEHAIVSVNHEYGFGTLEAQQDLAIVPPCSNLVYEVEMLDFIKEKAPWEMTDTERIEAAGRKKEEGNVLFKAGKYQRAAKKYDKAADYVGEDGNFGDGDQKLVKALRVYCWLNGAACSLKLNDFKEAINLYIEFQNVKALYRRAQAYMETADLLLAEVDIKKALEVDPANRELKLLHRNLQQLQAESNRRDAKIFANMFTWTSKDSSAPSKEEEGVPVEIERTADSSVPVGKGTAPNST
ncbi:hypothetical protein CRG98_007127 [Punica granatum]|uniref:peptidylprolyl isomerase n=1 Tax=Punica granatum TaxID=22663 RepID=A0A2I0KVU9_PUNGR|nr:hypothetical protein CRG98_007127 [Punica granatum]